MKKKRIKNSSILFDKETNTRCPKCRKKAVKYREYESSDGAYEDYQYKCQLCGYTWWVDGPDY